MKIWRQLNASVTLACGALLFGGPSLAEATARPGLALRAAVDAQREGRVAEAAASFESVAATWPIVGDHAWRLASEAWLATGDGDRALAAARKILVAVPDSPLDSEAARLEAEAQLAQGDRAAALEAYQRAHASADTTDERRPLRAAIAQIHEALGQPEAARNHWMILWRQVPGTPEDELAIEALTRLEAAGFPAPAASEWALRAQSLIEARDPKGAVFAYEQAIASETRAKALPALARARAFALFHAREYPAALEAFESLEADPEVRLYRARSLARTGALKPSIDAFEAVAQGNSAPAWRARFLVATLLDDEPETLDRAMAHYTAVSGGSPVSNDRRSAAWRLAWLKRSTGDLAAAATAFEQLATGNPIAALRPRYWAARTRADLDAEAPEPRAEFLDIARRYPLSYYGWRAAERVGPSEVVRPEPARLSLGQERLGGAPIERIRILIEAGLLPAAGAEGVRLEGRARTLADDLLLADLAQASGRPDRASALAVIGNEVVLARGPAPGQERLWWNAWPRPWRENVEGRAQAEGIEPSLVWAVMREESGFRHAVVSPAGAHGLLQLMPETAERLAPELGSPGALPRSLHDPALNIRFGAHLLGRLTAQFGPRLSAVIAGYNAGEGPVAAWLKERPQQPDDEWIESISYDETRAYLRRVLRSVHAYRALY
ncbi:MAG: transglycosylase SLT domain-containing protein [Myxococcales bacterium]|nr:transglycosylase SLT domain-containing protein [Myxococcales bacterium]